MYQRHPLSGEYAGFIQQAAAAGLVPASGVTPRECRRLLQTEFTDSEDLQALTDLVERCVYARHGEQHDLEHGKRLCRRLKSQLPPISAANRTAYFVKPLRLAIPILLVAGTVGLVVVCIVKARQRWHGNGASSHGPSVSVARNVARERRAIAKFGGTWQRASSQRTVAPGVVAPILESRDPTSASGPSFDVDTGTDIDRVETGDPFQPGLNWTHRLHVYTSLSSDLRFQTSQQLRPANSVAQNTSGTTFHVRARFHFASGVPTRIPSPSPDAVVLSCASSPSTEVRFLKSRGDELLAVCDESRTIDLSYDVSENRSYRVAQLPDVPMPEVNRGRIDVVLPRELQDEAERVIQAIGDVPGSSFAETVRRLHAYFAGYVVAPVAAEDEAGSHFLTTSLSRKGTCRHRARDFFVVANTLGIRTRLVENRVHSFAEVALPNGTWRRLEFRLGDDERPLASAGNGNRDFGPEGRLGRVAGLGPAAWTGALVAPLLIILLWWNHAEASAHVLRPAVRVSNIKLRASRDMRQATSVWSATRLQQLIQQKFDDLGRADGKKPPPAICSDYDAVMMPGEALHDRQAMMDFYWRCRRILRWLRLYEK